MLIVKKIKREDTKHFIMEKHYAHRMPSISYAFGLYDGDELIGVCTYGKPASYTLCNGVCGKEYSKYVWELNRLVLKYNRKNEASFFISKTLKMIPSPAIIVSFADTEQKHRGTIYQAANFIYAGVSPRQKYYRLKTSNEIGGYRRRARMSKEKIISEYGIDFVQEYFSSNKHRYIYFVGTKNDKRTMKKMLKYEIKPFPAVGGAKKTNFNL